MAGAWTTVSILDGGGTSRTMRAWDESGTGAGPFSFASTIADLTGAGSVVIKAASTAAAATDESLVTNESPNSQISATTGITTGAAVITDATGTLQQYLRGLVKLIAAGISVAITNANANVQSGAPVTMLAVVPTAVANGATSSRVKAAATTNATSLKASAGQIYSVDIFNNAAYAVYLKLYNKASAPTVGTDTPIWTIPVAAGGGFCREFPRGKTFATGIAYAITKLEADTDTTVIVADDLTGSIDWV
jgi:hypothetical protein